MHSSYLWEVASIISKTSKTKHPVWGIRLKAGDFIRLGRNPFKVIEIIDKNNKDWGTNLSEEIKNEKEISESQFDDDIEDLEMEITDMKRKI